MSSSCAKSLLQCELPADDQPLNLGSAFIDLANPDIAIYPCDGAIVEIAITAMDLDRAVAANSMAITSIGAPAERRALVSEAALNLYWLKLPGGRALSRTRTVLVIEILQPGFESVLLEIAAGLPSRFAARHGRRTMMHYEDSLA